METNKFSLRRFGMLLRIEIATWWKIGSIGLLLFILSIILLTYFSKAAFVGFNYLLFVSLYTGIFLCTFSFNNYFLKKKAVISLLVPASKIEKFIVLLLSGLIVPILIFLLSYLTWLSATMIMKIPIKAFNDNWVMLIFPLAFFMSSIQNKYWKMAFIVLLFVWIFGFAMNLSRDSLFISWGMIAIDAVLVVCSWFLFKNYKLVDNGK